MRYSRRQLFPLALVPLLVKPALAADLQETIAGIEADSGGRLGVALLDTASGALSGHRLDERFPMCSTFKALLAAAILTKVDAGAEQLRAPHSDRARRHPVLCAGDQGLCGDVGPVGR